jgi:DNA-binding NarL/FixJ family response regulator/tRNA A-37 threonylcarbamoyl transferase component Bud32
MIGRKLRNRYDIREHLGDGSTATVYKAYDERLGRDVAIKMLLPHVRETTRKRFFQEANAAAQLNHPNIMAIYDIDEEDERHFLVTEYVDGLTLSHYIPSPPQTVVDLGAQIARALNYAHDREIIHRDIKPANIKVTSSGQVKIMDLGLALPREAKRVTAHGMVIGTPAYLSPEQAQGQKLDSRTDIYSLGIVLYEMVTGQLPFNADDIGALLLQQVKQPPPPPRLMVPDLPVELQNVVLKTLEKVPARRYQSGNALAEALEASMKSATSEATMAEPTPATGTVDSLASERSNEAVTQSRKPQRTLRVILADDHTLLRKTLANLLETREDFVVVAEAGDGDAALKQTLAILPDVLVLDLNMPMKGGLEILPTIRRDAPSVKVLVLTGREEEVYIVRALRAGAHGYVLKSAEEGELIEAIGKVTSGQLYLGRGVAEKVVTGLLTGHSPSETSLNDEESKLLLYVAAGYENEQIARRMEIPMMNVIEMLARVMNKMGAKDRHAAALKALRMGAILIEDLHHLSVE